MRLAVKELLILSGAHTRPRSGTVLFHCVTSGAPNRTRRGRLLSLSGPTSVYFIVKKASLTTTDTVVPCSEITSCIIGETRGLIVLQLSVHNGFSSSISTIAEYASIDVLKSSTHTIPIYYY